MRLPRPALAGLLLLGLAGTASALPGLGTAGEREIAGTYEFGFERQAFRPCGLGEVWWVGIAPAALRAEMGERVFVVVRASVSEPGGYGHLAQYARQMSVSEVLHREPAGTDDCRRWEEAGQGRRDERRAGR